MKSRLNFDRKFSGSNKSMAVLIVDDSLTIQRIHKVLLKKFRVDSEVVGNGREAVNLLRSGANFDFILMDFDMPVMDGLEATTALRAMGVKSIIVGVTTRNQQADKDAFMAAGANCCYTKPLTSDRIAAILQQQHI